MQRYRQLRVIAISANDESEFRVGLIGLGIVIPAQLGIQLSPVFTGCLVCVTRLFQPLAARVNFIA